jgi:sulfite exporter TauE/SafE
MDFTAFTVTTLTLPVAALTTGFLGSLHCLGMCGGVSGTIALGSAVPSHRSPPGPALALAIAIPLSEVRGPSQALSGAQANVLAFNAGRIASYMVAGALAGSIGGAIGQGWVLSETVTARTTLFLFANLMIVATGLYLMGIPQLLAPLERAGGLLWRQIAPYTKKLLPMNTLPRAALFGMLWGWIPCGMVYAMLLSAMSAGSTALGMLTMLAFGVGTLPAMITAGWAAAGIGRWTRDTRVRLLAGAAVVAMGLFGFARADGLQQLQSFGAFCVSVIHPASVVTP